MRVVQTLILAALLAIAAAQGGGGRSGGSRSRSSSSQRSRSNAASRARRQAEIQACKAKCSETYAFDEEKLRECNTSCDPPLSPYLIGGIISLIGGAVGWAGYSDYADRKKLVDTFTKEHSAAIEGFEMQHGEFESKVQELTTGKWRIVFYQGANTYNTDDFQIAKGATEDRYLQKVKLSSSDHFGKWNGDGLISVSHQGVRFWMLKDYSDKKKAGQTGEWKFLMYKGELRDDKFKGDWWYKGHEGSGLYSGQFQMLRLKQQ